MIILPKLEIEARWNIKRLWLKLLINFRIEAAVWSAIEPSFFIFFSAFVVVSCSIKSTSKTPRLLQNFPVEK